MKDLRDWLLATEELHLCLHIRLLLLIALIFTIEIFPPNCNLRFQDMMMMMKGGHMMMMMYFHGGFDEVILFDAW